MSVPETLLDFLINEFALHEYHLKEKETKGLDHGVIERPPWTKMVRHMADGWRPILPASNPDEMNDLIARCCAANPADRPSFEMILRELVDLATLRSNAEAAMNTVEP
eukprot:CAMPEP_0118979062 /NCGR_PEP_ID=MMETSP1173-20130426/25086_1 /TAXON_ID=1034831 /ORGANISM="Rhizochromulina marina cf, Strain CCMP1243" /LENGTH=107 /DNA_ID=CAMNT_0006929303 /DNA_START=42 /DNA_END=361 /DNA_ORIENTATION=+